MSQRLTTLTCRAARQRPLLAEFVRNAEQPRMLSSTTTADRNIRQHKNTARKVASHSSTSRNALLSTRKHHPRSLLFTHISPFSTTTTTASSSAVATLNPRVDDDGNPMYIEISPRAAKRLGEIVASSKDSHHLRVTVTSGGCHGFQYMMSLEPASKLDQTEDTLFEATDDGQARVVMDQPSLELLSGSTVDFTTELIGSQFKVNNPRATSNCGCGSSFDIGL